MVSGAVTTMLSGLMLVFPSFIFFYKMGCTILSVVLLALLWALVFFTSMVALIGPEGDQGDLNKYLVHCPCKQCKKEEEQSAEAGNTEGNEVELETKA